MYCTCLSFWCVFVLRGFFEACLLYLGMYCTYEVRMYRAVVYRVRTERTEVRSECVDLALILVVLFVVLMVFLVTVIFGRAPCRRAVPSPCLPMFFYSLSVLPITTSGGYHHAIRVQRLFLSLFSLPVCKKMGRRDRC